MKETHAAIERAARESYSRLVAFLAVRSGDVAAAEDALADAFRAALENWPAGGVPRNPEAWLLTAARRRLADGARHARVQSAAVPELLALSKDWCEPEEGAAFPDERLKLLFICAHPAIDVLIRTPLMLQTVLGLDAARIAAAFLVQPAAMGQRLSRAKAKIRDAGIQFALPEPSELPARLDAVLEAVYAAYGSGWEDVSGADSRRKGLAGEAIYLGRLLLNMLPEEPEVAGLLALMLHCEGRRFARRSSTGEYVLLSEQDPALWSKPMLEEAEAHLLAASRAGRIGRFQLEAAIQSVHAQRALTGRTDWEAISLLYEGLARLAPTAGSLVGRAAAVAEAHGAEAGWRLLTEFPAQAGESYQPYWALRAHLLTRLGQHEQAHAAYLRAIDLCQDEAVCEYLRRQAASLAASGAAHPNGPAHRIPV